MREKVEDAGVPSASAAVVFPYGTRVKRGCGPAFNER
jgi:hypothetical protein